MAALAIVLFHAAALSGDAIREPAGRYLSHLDLAVPVFFVLSGFLLYRPFVAAHLHGSPSPALGRYAVRRFLRIYPAYWVAMTVTVYVLHQARIGTFGDFVVFYGLLQIYSGRHIFGGLAPAWSLCTEVTFYAFLPVYAIAVGSRRRHERREWVGLLILYLISVGFRLWLLRTGAHIGYATLPAYTDVFALGMGLAVVSVVAPDRVGGVASRIRRTLGGAPALVWTAAGALFWVLCNMGLPRGFEPLSTSQSMAEHLLAGAIAVLVVGPAVFAASGSVFQRLLACQVLRWLGLISYGIYLWHLTWLEWVAEHTSGPPSLVRLLGLGLGATLLTAAASFVALERPLLRPRDTRRSRAGAWGR